MNELVLVANPGDDTIATFRLDDDKMAPLATSHVPSCGTFAIDEQRDLVFAASKDGPSVRTLRLDRTTGELTEIHRRPVEAPLAYVALSFDATRLLLASYRGGFGTAHLVHDDGTVGDPVGRIDHPNIHAVATSPDDAYAYFCSLGADLIAQCALGSDGSLTPLDPPTVPAPPGSGPRHIVLTREGTDAYVVTEFSGEVLHFRRDPATGALAEHDRRSIVDPSAGLARSAYGRDPRAEHLIWGADVHVTEGTLWASERTASTLATVTAGPALGDVLAFASTEEQPRGFAVSPDGRRLVAAGERSGAITLYDVSDRVPRPLQSLPSGKGANWVRIIRA